MTGVVLIILIAGCVPLGLAWQVSENDPGTTADADFYLLIQSTAMQLLGIFLATSPLVCAGAFDTVGRRWVLAFGVAGSLCAVASVPMYLFTPKIWTGLLSFFGSAAEVAMILELSMMRSEEGSGDGEREKQD